MAKQSTAEKIEPVEEKRKVSGITVARFGLLEEKNRAWRVDVPVDHTPEDTLNEHYWEHVSMHLRPGDEIRVMPDNMAWEQVLHVVNAGKLFAHVVQKALYELVPSEQGIHLPSIYKVEFAGTTHKWRVIRSGRPLKDGFETEALARRYAANHEAATQR